MPAIAAADRRRRRLALSVVAAAAMLATSVGAAAAAPSRLPAAPRTPHETAAIEGFAPDQAQFFCRTTVEPGVKAFERLTLATYKGTVSDGDMRGCFVGGTSEHKDGRAWDWGVDHRIPKERAAGESMLRWLFATDAYGNKDAMFRRLGLMYVIWNKRIWGAWDQRWQPYACSGPTLCHVNHMHFSFGWAGALRKTSYWTGKVSPVLEPSLPILRRLHATRRLTVAAKTGTADAMWLAQAGATYRVVASGRWRDGTSRSDAACTKTSNGWQPSAHGGLNVGGDQLQLWGERWVPTHDAGNGCNTTDHRYQLRLTPLLLTTVTAQLPGGGSGASGALRLHFERVR
jgi:hypothetical protein